MHRTTPTSTTVGRTRRRTTVGRTRRRTTTRLARRAGAALLATGLVLASAPALADGTETLGDPSIPIADGSGFVAAGTGLVVQPGTIDVTVPAGATVEQVLLYWEGHSATPAGVDDTIVVDGNDVVGTLIGGPTYFFGTGSNTHLSTAYRADITALGLVSAGANSLSVSGLAFDQVNDGAGVLVIYDDGSESELAVRDGVDLAFVDFPAPRDTTVAQTFTFAAEDVDRSADLAMFFSSVTGQDFPGERPSVVEITVDGTTTQLVDLLGSNDGEEWDTLVAEVTIPAGATELTVQALSADVSGTGNRPASFAWITASLSVPIIADEPPPGGEGCTPGYWKQPQHADSWVGYAPGDSYDTVFGVDAAGDLSLLEALSARGGGESALARHAVAALLNSASPDVDSDFTEAEVIALVQGAYASGDIEGVKDLLDESNNAGCPLS